ncbi:MAG: NlpC/P60 family protein [Actinomycetota bacterium]|nr:NlpC/P60 family protein [Actinomycetota bacterium]
MKTSLIASKRLNLVLFILLALLFSFPTQLVMAVPQGDLATKSQQAAQVSREIDALDKELSVATEAYDRVKSELDKITEKVDQTRQHLGEIKQSLYKRREILNQRACALYKNGRTSALEVILNTKNFSDFLERADYVVRVTESDTSLINRIKEARDSVADIERNLAEQQHQEEGLVQQAAAEKNVINQKLAERQQLLASINQEIQQMLAEESRRRAAESKALEERAKEVLVNAPEAGIAKTAMRYLGVPYHWAGEGPGKCPTGEHRICFDCSGLTMYVYKLYGISLPHNAAMQFNRGIKVPISQARSGDLVFFGMPPHHVGIYLGNDMFIHAPQTGDVVKVSRLSSRSDFSGACRFIKD